MVFLQLAIFDNLYLRKIFILLILMIFKSNLLCGGDRIDVK